MKNLFDSSFFFLYHFISTKVNKHPSKPVEWTLVTYCWKRKWTVVLVLWIICICHRPKLFSFVKHSGGGWHSGLGLVLWGSSSTCCHIAAKFYRLLGNKYIMLISVKGVFNNKCVFTQPVCLSLRCNSMSGAYTHTGVFLVDAVIQCR